MYPAGVSTRRIEDVGEILWGAGVSAGTVSNLNEKTFKAVDEWRCRPLTRAYPCVYIDGIYLKRSWERLLRECSGDGGDRRERGRIPRGHRPRRGLHGIQGVLARLPVLAEVARTARRSHGRRLQGRQHDRLDRLGVPECQISALHGALLPQRAGQGPQIEAFAGCGHAQRHPRHGVARQIQIDPLVEDDRVAVATGLPVAGHAWLHQQPLALVVVIGCNLVRQRGA